LKREVCMGKKRTWMVIGVVCLAVVMLSSYLVIAKLGAPAGQPGEPPFGLALQGDAAGTRLTGVLYVEFYNLMRDPACMSTASDPCRNCPLAYADARIVLRLQKGDKDLQTFFGEVVGTGNGTEGKVYIQDAAAMQEAVTSVMAPQIAEGFFPGKPNVRIVLRSMKNFGNITAPNALADYAPSTDSCGDAQGISDFSIADVEIAAK